MSYSHPSSANNLAQAAAIPNRPSPTASLLLFQLPALSSYSYSNLVLFFNNFFLFVLCTLVLCLQICLYEGTGYLGRKVQIVMECHVGAGN